LNFAFEGIFVKNICCIDIFEFNDKVIHKLKFVFTIFNDSMSFILNKLFLNYDVNCEGDVI